jgi:hypothetical protein
VTAVLAVPVTVAVNCWFCEALSEVVDGVSETVTGGLRLMVALADLAESATLWAVTVTVCDVRILDGAVYRPVEEIVPTGGLIDQVTAGLLVPKTVAVNC